MAHTRAAVLAYPAPEILRIEHSQANPLKLSLAWDPASEMPSGLTLRAEIHPSRTVADDAVPLAAVTLDITDADTQPWTLEFSSQQTNLDLGGRDQKTFVLTITGIESSTRLYTLADADLVLFRHPCSQLVPAAVSPLLYATTEDFDDLEARVTVIEETGGGGGATDLLAVPSLTNVVIESSTGDAATIPAANGTNAGVMLPAQVTKLAGVATGATANATDSFLRSRTNHTGTQATSTIDGLDAALAAKADLVDGKLNASQLPDLAVTQYLGTAANQAAMLLLVGQQGDWCVRLDDGKVYVVTAQPSSTLSNWTSLSYPTAPVLSVAGRTGAVTITADDITDSTPAGRGLLTAADAGAQRNALGLAGSIPAGAGTELQYRDSGALAALSGSSVSGSALTVAELRVNAGDAATGFRATHVSGLTTLAFYGTGTNGFFYAAAGNTQVNYRGTAFRIEGPSGTDATALLQIASTNRVIMRARGLNNLCLGPADAASPAAQSISVQSATGTNASAATAVFCLDGAQGTGTGVGGDILFRVAPTGSTGATQNTLLETLRLRASDRATVCAGAVVAGGPVTLATFTVATVPAASLWTRGLIYVSDEVGGPTPAFSDGTNWRRVADRAVVSTP